MCSECVDIHIKYTSYLERQLSLAETRVLCGCVQDALRDHRVVDGGSSNTNSSEEQQPGRGDDQLITPSDALPTCMQENSHLFLLQVSVCWSRLINLLWDEQSVHPDSQQSSSSSEV